MAHSQLSCPVCYEGFNEADHLPVLIECGHPFCKACIKQGGSTLSKCPQCRGPIGTTSGSLKTNHELVRAIQRLDVTRIDAENQSDSWFQDNRVSYAEMLASLAPLVKCGVLEKLSHAGFDTDRWGGH